MDHPHSTSNIARPWAAVAAIGLATFSVVTTEMLPVGLLSPITETLHTSTGNGGLMISLPALLAALFAPLVVMASGSIDRRKILCGLMFLLVVANAASAFATSMAGMLVARALVGFCMGGIWAIAGGLAARLVPDHAVGLATSIIFGGVAAASVLGVPLGALAGDLAGWRWVFAGMAVFSTWVLLFLFRVVSPLPVASTLGAHAFVKQLGNHRLQGGLLLTLLLVAGHFTAFTFVRPLLSLQGFDAQWISVLLFGYGVTGFAGNFLAGIAAARHPATTLAAIALGLLLTPVLLLTLWDSPGATGMVLLLWGLAYGGVSVGLMTWMIKAAPQAVEVASACYVAVFNVGIALGAWVGGTLVDAIGLAGNFWLASALAAFAVLLTLALGKGSWPQAKSLVQRAD